MVTIKTCPFCRNGNCVVLEFHDQPGHAYSVGCPDCGSIGPMAIDNETAIDLWNDRLP